MLCTGKEIFHMFEQRETCKLTKLCPRRNHETHRKRFFRKLCQGKVMTTFTEHQQRKKEEGKMLRGERDQIKFTDLRFERWQVVGLRKARGR